MPGVIAVIVIALMNTFTFIVHLSVYIIHKMYTAPYITSREVALRRFTAL